MSYQHPLVEEETVLLDQPASSHQTAQANTDVLQQQQGLLRKLPHHQRSWILQQCYPVVYDQVYHAQDASSGHCLAVLGYMSFLLDDFAGDHVFGVPGTTGRPRGCMTLDKVCSMDDDSCHSKLQQHRWLQFLQIWKAAGWERSNLVLLIRELRLSRYGHHLDQAHIATIGLEHMLLCIDTYADSQGPRRTKLKEDLIRLVNVVHHHFSSPNAVLVCNPDAMANISKVKIVDV